MSTGRKFCMYLSSVKNRISSLQQKITMGQPLNIKDTEFLEHQFEIYRKHYESDVAF